MVTTEVVNVSGFVENPTCNSNCARQHKWIFKPAGLSVKDYRIQINTSLKTSECEQKIEIEGLTGR